MTSDPGWMSEWVWALTPRTPSWCPRDPHPLAPHSLGGWLWARSPPPTEWLWPPLAPPLPDPGWVAVGPTPRTFTRSLPVTSALGSLLALLKASNPSKELLVTALATLSALSRLGVCQPMGAEQKQPFFFSNGFGSDIYWLLGF